MLDFNWLGARLLDLTASASLIRVPDYDRIFPDHYSFVTVLLLYIYKIANDEVNFFRACL
jgi:hypothetical protein